MKTTKNNKDLQSMLETITQKQYKVVNERDKRFGVIYTRVSSQEQKENNSSLEMQSKRVKNMLKDMA